MTLTSRNGKLWITFYHQSSRYRRSLELDDTKKNRKLAEQQIIPEIIYKLNHGMFFKSESKQEKVPTVSEFVKVSFEIHMHTRKELTQKSYWRMYEMHIKPQFAKRRLDTIKASDLARWQNNLLKTRSGKTVRTLRTVFQTILEDAMMDEIIKFNPFSRVKAPRLTESREKKPFLMEDMFLIIDAMPKLMQCYFAIGFFTGMRTGEIIGLKWKDVNFEELTIQVKRSRHQGMETKPKTKSSIREVDIRDALFPYLEQHRAICDNAGIYLFETYMGQPYNTCDKISSHYWKPTLKRLNIPYRNLYQMRHSFASLMISSGEDILWVSNMLGHKDSSMTLEVYAKYVKQTDKKRAVFLSK
ncbi:tyrosine-type recombinase/integrase [Sulfurovum sp. CS9]|uniref:tyrosine-type recombinase/integrase n=1 Tax=Sulfurovum sp. CS9 TaxID=3391146 RepID=UPI0039E7D911